MAQRESERNKPSNNLGNSKVNNRQAAIKKEKIRKYVVEEILEEEKKTIHLKL